MAYRKKHPGAAELSSVKGEEEGLKDTVVPQPPLLAAKAIRASSAHRDSSLSAAYSGYNAPSSPAAYASSRSSSSSFSYSTHKDLKPSIYNVDKSSDETKRGFWGALVGKAKAILDDDNNQQSGKMTNTRPEIPSTPTEGMRHQYDPHVNRQKMENPALQKGLHAITSSINYIGNAVEEGLTTVEKRTVNLIQETRKQIRKKPSSSDAHNQTQQQRLADLELQLKASRDVGMAMAAKAKLLLRELKTVKADLAFAKERCSQLEEENKILRENRDRGDHPEDDEMIRLQLETLLAEKARLAHENSVYARENRFLREIVEYHQLTMQDVVYFDENNEEVTEVYPIKVSSSSSIQPHSTIPAPPAPKLPREDTF